MQDSDNRDRSLTAALRAVADDESGLGASMGVQARLLAEVRSIALARRRRYTSLFAAAAALLLAIALPAWRVSERGRLASSDVSDAPGAVSTGEVMTGFLPLTYGDVPTADGQIVRLEVPRAALASFGLGPLDGLEGAISGTVQADVFVGEDGIARAVRFVRPVAQ